MVQEITKYRTSSGSEFSTFEDAQKHERLSHDCDRAIMGLGERPRLDNGDWIQHDKEVVMQARRNLLAIIRQNLDVSHYAVFQNPDDVIHPMSAAGRILDDFGGPMSKAWFRLACINFDTGREYNQPYYALNPNEAKQG